MKVKKILGKLLVVVAAVGAFAISKPVYAQDSVNPGTTVVVSDTCPGVTCDGDDGCPGGDKSRYVRWQTVPTGKNTSHNYVCKYIDVLDNTTCTTGKGHVLSTSEVDQDGCIG